MLRLLVAALGGEAPRPRDRYLQLEAHSIVMTCELLVERIEYRMPRRGLARVARSLRNVAGDAVARAFEIQRPNVLLRLVCYLLAAAILGVVCKFAFHLRFTDASGWEMLQGIESGVGTIVYLGVAILFVVTLEGRLKRRQALAAIHELRALAHVIDMHQLGKDPERLAERYGAGDEYESQQLDPYDLGRYLDYCSDLLSLLGKVAVLYGRGNNDGVVLAAIDEVERLTTGLSQKIWQKIMILDQIIERREGTPSTQPVAPTPH